MEILGGLGALAFFVCLAMLIYSSVKKKKKLWWVLGIIAGSVIMIITTSSSPDSASPKTSAPEKTQSSTTEYREYQMIKQWAGNGIKTTESFYAAKPWLVRWSHIPQDFYGTSLAIFQIYVYKSSSSQIFTVAANTNKQAADDSYVQASGEFYLTVNAANTNWVVEVWSK